MLFEYNIAIGRCSSLQSSTTNRCCCCCCSQLLTGDVHRQSTWHCAAIIPSYTSCQSLDTRCFSLFQSQERFGTYRGRSIAHVNLIPYFSIPITHFLFHQTSNDESCCLLHRCRSEMKTFQFWSARKNRLLAVVMESFGGCGDNLPCMLACQNIHQYRQRDRAIYLAT